MIDEKIKQLGDDFRGLQNTQEVIYMTKEIQEHRSWYVTFKYKGEYIETIPCGTMGEALDYTILYLKE